MGRLFLHEQKGYIMVQACIVMVLVFIALVLPLSFTFSQHKRSVLNDVLDKSLQRAAVEGGLTEAGRQSILHDLAGLGFDITSVIITPCENTECLRGEIIEMTISVPLNVESLRGLSAIGADPPEPGTRIIAKGSIMSEKLP